MSKDFKQVTKGSKSKSILDNQCTRTISPKAISPKVIHPRPFHPGPSARSAPGPSQEVSNQAATTAPPPSKEVTSAPGPSQEAPSQATPTAPPPPSPLTQPKVSQQSQAGRRTTRSSATFSTPNTRLKLQSIRGRFWKP
ncbi:hypothetical protein VNO80_07204 [Phaseolus coccineus]|uniref:Uncharacterized protein n=1 Tax=Phaseolus coccineus TaxID=3886 RepID=A0AAN9NI83_PHACN